MIEIEHPKPQVFQPVHVSKSGSCIRNTNSLAVPWYINKASNHFCESLSSSPNRISFSPMWWHGYWVMKSEDLFTRPIRPPLTRFSSGETPICEFWFNFLHFFNMGYNLIKTAPCSANLAASTVLETWGTSVKLNRWQLSAPERLLLTLLRPRERVYNVDWPQFVLHLLDKIHIISRQQTKFPGGWLGNFLLCFII